MKHFFRNKYLLFFALVIVFLSHLPAQVPNPASFNTGVNATLNSTIPLGGNDLSWTTSSISINGPYVPAVRGVNPVAWLTSPYTNADWITYPHTCSSNPTDQTCELTINEYFRLTFDLPPVVCNNSVSSSTGYSLTMNYFADNCVNEIFVNGVSQFSNPSPSYFANNFVSYAGTTLTLVNNWQVGTNTLIVHVMSGPPTVGFLAFITATASSPGGYTATPLTKPACLNATNGSATVSLQGYTGPSSYTWLPAGSTGSTAYNLGSGIYTVNIQLPLCNFNQTVLVAQAPPPAVTVSTMTPLCFGQPFTYTANGAESYSWSPVNLTGQSITVFPAVSSVYTLTGTNAAGCIATTLFTVQVANCTNLNENRLQSFNISKSVNGTLLLTMHEANQCKIEIFTLYGTLKYSKEVNSSGEVAIEGLLSDLYILKVTDSDSSITQKIVLGN